MAADISLRNRKIVPNRIFLAYQWQTYRPIYEAVCVQLHHTFPVYFYAIGRPQGQPAEALMDRIESVMLSSTSAVFDASKGNPNVSLEYGMARIVPHFQTHLLIDQHVLPTHSTVGTPIISDLAGATHNKWDVSKPDTLESHLRAIAERHPYTTRFRQYCRSRRLKAGQFRVPLKVIRLFDEVDSMLRREVLDQLGTFWKNKKPAAIEALISDLHKFGLITITSGREWASRVFLA